MCCDYTNAVGGEPIGYTLLTAWRAQNRLLAEWADRYWRLRAEADRANLARWESMLGDAGVG